MALIYNLFLCFIPLYFPLMINLRQSILIKIQNNKKNEDKCLRFNIAVSLCCTSVQIWIVTLFVMES